MRYFDTNLRTEVSVAGEFTLESTDARVAAFFNPLTDSKKLTFTSEGLPLLTDVVPPTKEDISNKAIRAEQQEASIYLMDTDWYVVRFIDSGVDIPIDVKDKRASARLLA